MSPLSSNKGDSNHDHLHVSPMFNQPALLGELDLSIPRSRKSSTLHTGKIRYNFHSYVINKENQFQNLKWDKAILVAVMRNVSDRKQPKHPCARVVRALITSTCVDVTKVH